MLLLNTPDIPGKKIIQTLCMVKGTGFRHLVGGEMKENSEMLNEARQIATKIMVDEAKNLGAKAIINVRYTTSSVIQGAAEILAYGTAVIYEE